MIRKISLLFAGALMGASAMSLVYGVPGSAANAAGSETYKQLAIFGDIFERVRGQYVTPPDEKALVENAINGMLTSLDPHSSYLNPEAAKDMRVQTKGEFGGLGIEVTMENGVVKVVAPIDDTPAARAGLLANDLITHLDGEQVLGMTLNEAVDKMRGKISTPITLTILRPGKEDPFDVKLTRDVIRIKSVKANAEGDIGYLRISSFTEQTQEGLDEAIAKLKTEVGGNLKGWIIDLRNNPGGLLDQARSVADTFLGQGEVVSTRGRNASETQRFNATPGDSTDGKPIVVLINGGSASASEIVAGALQDHKRATVIGTRSFGKGSVQTIIPLGSQGAMRLTTARYFTPAGVSIQAKGIVPNIVIEEDLPPDLKPSLSKTEGEASLRGHLKSENGEEQTGSSSYVPKEKEKDKQLRAAIDLLHGKQVVSNVKPPETDNKAQDGKQADDKTTPQAAPTTNN